MSGTLVNNPTSRTLRCLRKATGYALLIGASASLLAGCMSFSPRSLSSMERALMQSNPELVIASSTKFGLGALTLDFVDFAFVHNSAIDLSKVSRADIGVYELRDTLALEDFKAPEDGVDGSCAQRETIMRIREDDSYVDVVACIRKEKVIGLSMFMVEPKEIVVINTRGNLEAMLETMVRNNMNGEKRAKERAERRRDERQNPELADQDAGAAPPSS